MTSYTGFKKTTWRKKKLYPQDHWHDKWRVGEDTHRTGQNHACCCCTMCVTRQIVTKWQQSHQIIRGHPARIIELQRSLVRPVACPPPTKKRKKNRHTEPAIGDGNEMSRCDTKAGHSRSVGLPSRHRQTHGDTTTAVTLLLLLLPMSLLGKIGQIRTIFHMVHTPGRTYRGHSKGAWVCVVCICMICVC